MPAVQASCSSTAPRRICRKPPHGRSNTGASPFRSASIAQPIASLVTPISSRTMSSKHGSCSEARVAGRKKCAIGCDAWPRRRWTYGRPSGRPWFTRAKRSQGMRVANWHEIRWGVPAPPVIRSRGRAPTDGPELSKPRPPRRQVIRVWLSEAVVLVHAGCGIVVVGHVVGRVSRRPIELRLV